MELTNNNRIPKKFLKIGIMDSLNPSPELKEGLKYHCLHSLGKWASEIIADKICFT
jgi:hypothetical protein